jgi:hypothetical protein
MDWVQSRNLGFHLDLARPGVKTGPYVRRGRFAPGGGDLTAVPFALVRGMHFRVGSG